MGEQVTEGALHTYIKRNSTLIIKSVLTDQTVCAPIDEIKKALASDEIQNQECAQNNSAEEPVAVT